MALTLATATRNAACNAIVDLIDVSAPGTLKFYTTGLGTLLGTCTFSNPAFGAAATGTATAGAITSDTSADDTGTCAEFVILDGAATEILRGSVSTSGADINFDSVSFVAGGTIAVTSLTLTVPAS